VNLPDLNFSNSNIENVHLSVLHCEVPNSFYIVNYTNNQIVVNGVTYTLTRGNYNANTMITQLLSILPGGYGLTYSNITNRYTFTHTTTNFTINASNINCTINSVLGLGSADLTSTSLTLALQNNVNFLPIPRLNFKSNIFKFGNFNQTDNSGNLFLSLQNNAPQQGCINYQNSNLLRFLIEDKSITSFLITVTDDFGNLINFNNVDWYLTYQIDIEFKETVSTYNFNSVINQNFGYN
jgi:hypothetical protein